MEWIHVFVYLLALAAFTMLGAPLAAVFFQALPRKGAAFALPTALLPFTIAVFWVGQLTFGLPTLVIGVAVPLVGAVAATRSGVSPEWRSVATMYGVFAVGFGAMIAFRAADPGLTPTGGEQFLHLGIVNAIERANSLPPEDMWFAGRPLRYYYGTQLQVASLSMLTGTPVRYGFNLGIATFYGLLFVVAYGVGGAIVYRREHSFHLGGVFAAFFVALAGPTTTAIRLATPYLPKFLAEPIKPTAFGFVANRFNDGDLARTVAELSEPLDWTWWYTRYVVPGTIQEVPLYSFVKADLHGHTFANGYVLFAGGFALAYYATLAEERIRRLGIVFGGLGSAAGLFGFMNTWSLPTAAGLAGLAIAAAEPHPATLLPAPWADRLQPSSSASANDRIGWLARELWRLVLAAIAAIIVLAIGIGIASPFLVFGHVPSNNGIGVLPPRSPLGPFLVIYGGLLTVFALYVLTHGWPMIQDIPSLRLAVGGLTLVGVMSAVTLVVDFGVLAVLGPLLVAGWLLVRSDRGGYGLVLLIAGAGLLLSLELVHARLPLIDNPRWNTSLKVAVQAWTLGATGAGAATAVLLARNCGRLARLFNPLGTNGKDDIEGSARSYRTPHSKGTRPDPRSAVSNGRPPATVDTATTLHSVLTIALVVLVLLASAVFPIMVVGTEIGVEVAENRYDPSLDGFNYVEQSHEEEARALRWLKNQSGSPTILEAPGGSYEWTSPAATFSGLPGVIGWNHEAEYRSPKAYNRRVNRADAIFTGNWSTAARYLKRYNVTYVYIGPNERERYGSELRSFDREAFSVAFKDDAVTIYEVNQPARSTSEE